MSILSSPVTWGTTGRDIRPVNQLVTRLLTRIKQHSEHATCHFDCHFLQPVKYLADGQVFKYTNRTLADKRHNLSQFLRCHGEYHGLPLGAVAGLAE